ncbi:5'-3' exonuclease H3TH domain-containing protein [Gracilibacillus sp. S3-1-1]|uniref:5'-3' exonuclease H3TH domain-containing protein n=1 Tax=Gracilibacillus pellucidus TaxID=3095368 RepID=A0ACC6M5X4_9BACI|nr:5'-3' exonuclease H3TH domain-containing protein [Gracilibacillus sp. S3-1-1]MDX8046247.1 5'-3' exonuclease H3TH domain-containing protein [Gracilibacillus sp. S3-1-1]
MTNRSHVLIVDGMALLFRGFFATAFTGKFMENSKGIPRNGLFGFLNYFTNAVETFEPTHVICCWDMGSKTFRNDMYDGYKSNRDAPPEQLVPQFDLAKEIVTAFQVPNVGVTGYEADDCIGTLARELHEDHEVTVVTGDQDLLQLVDDNINIAIMKKGQGNYDVFNSDNFYEKKGLTPKQIIDLKGLMGDSADNYPGVKGVGEKTALKLLMQYETIDNMLADKENLTKGMQKKLDQYAEDLDISRKLAAIYTEVPLTFSIDTAEWNKDFTTIKSYLIDELEFTHPDRWLAKLAEEITD